MECERLKKLIKNWYVQVQDEAMAPARMVDFMRTHVDDCLTCMADPIVEIEVKRITEIILPPAKIKIPKAVRKENDQAKEEEEGSVAVVTDNEDDENVDQEEGDVVQDEDEDDIDPDDEDDEI